LVGPSSASVSNGDFETWNGVTTYPGIVFEGWDMSNIPDGQAIGCIAYGNQYDGDYSCLVSAVSNSGTITTYIYQDVDFTNYDSFSYVAKMNEYQGYAGKVYIDDTLVSSFTSTSWNTYEVDVSGYTGTHELRLVASSTGSGSWVYCRPIFDNIVLSGYTSPSVLYFDGSSSNQNWYINDTYLPFGVTKDGIIDYEIGSFDSDKIYMINDTSGTWEWTIDDDNGDSSDNSITERLNYQVSLPYEDTENSYTFTLWEISDVDKSDIPWYLIFIEPISWLIAHFSDDTPTYTELDTITINLYAVNHTSPEDLPEDLPEDTPEELPDYPYNDNETIPLPDVPDAPTNESLGGNYSGEFRESAEGIIGTSMNGTSGTVGFLLSPVTSLTVYVNYANATLAESYLSANSSQPVLIAIVPPLINAIPEKVQKYITFVLVLHLVLILLRWK